MKTTIAQKMDKVLEAVLKLDASERHRREMIDIWNKKVLTNADFALLFQIDVRSCYRWRKQKHIVYMKVCGKIYYSWEAVIALMEAKKIIE
ncbi:helix-turn-helix domain-containing protein [Pedobacter hartonius]|uniref:Helix-turn-helix domain-containing protein n=1 Tax=Pedobacter hartonius TaxID=425514 RepID=A0A1H3W1S0_9SPHI|nr:helix-turn-helix domain-containing protein [Pedobacter hartonius]SDZ80920.1 hypothetical protein SAMN05443550_10157 [Pedobacter hartonius]